MLGVAHLVPLPSLPSRAVEHPSVPEDPEYVRVRTYESQMVIRPHKTFDEVRCGAGWETEWKACRERASSCSSRRSEGICTFSGPQPWYRAGVNSPELEKG